MPVAFADFLAAKFALDERSLNREVRAAFLGALRGLPRIECLDVGAGTGATLRRFLESELTMPWSVTALDRDRDLLDRAREGLAEWLRARGLESRMEEDAVRTWGEGRAAVRFAAEELTKHCPHHLYNVITSHAFLDVMPLRQALRLFSGWLQQGGYLYSSADYNGETALSEPYEDGVFEARLLDYYNHTMERRLIDGQATGGAYCGRRLLQLLPEFGFTPIAHGSSDWNIAPLMGEYRDRDAVCLAALLGMIYSEGLKSGLFRQDLLDCWHADRQRLVEEGRLALHVHQTDVLARYDPSPEPLKKWASSPR